jgi:hypothetical protein
MEESSQQINSICAIKVKKREPFVISPILDIVKVVSKLTGSAPDFCCYKKQ